jgi:hypothetical protein
MGSPRSAAAQQSQKRRAGKRSGHMRACRAKERRRLVKAAFDTLKPQDQYFPFSDEAINALEAAYGRQLSNSNLDLGLLESAAFKVNRPKLIKDLQRLGIQSGRRIQRSKQRKSVRSKILIQR